MKKNIQKHFDDIMPDMAKTSLAVVALRRLVHAIEKNSSELARETGLNPTEFLTLHAIGAGGHETIRDLKRVVRLRASSVGKIVRALETRGYLTRSQSDKKSQDEYVTLTDRARDVLKRTPQLLQTVFLQNFSTLAGWEQAMIVVALQRTAELMNESFLKETQPHGGARANSAAGSKFH